ncbi:MAG: PRC-barrel domain-containing protein [Bdellovibrionales bacterium]|nr:PRC-barrel domain-containing protein [Bdellovibrionales bacterium]
MNRRNSLISMGSLKHDRVRNRKGEDIGKIEEFMIDIQSGKIEYAVLSFGGFLGMGNKLFAIPWKALGLYEDEKTFLMDVDKELLERSPGFSRNDWPDFADHSFLDHIDRYYGRNVSSDLYTQ